MKLKTFVTLTFLLLMGCELVVDVDIPLEERKLVLNSFFNPDSTWVAKVALNRHILDDAPYAIVEDADITVYQGATEIGKMQYDSLGFYSAKDFKAEVGKEYSIKATSSGYQGIEASSYCPIIIKADTSDFRMSVDEYGMTEYSFTLTFDDLPGRNYYQIAGLLQSRYKNPATGQGFIRTSPLQIWSDDKGIDDEQIYNAEGFYFDDGLFNGKRFSLKVKFTPNFWGGGVETKYFIYFRHVSADYFRYKVTSLLQSNTSGDPFAQPVKVFSNINNGFGIFGGYSQHVIVYKP
jgi:hypothetical protein